MLPRCRADAPSRAYTDARTSPRHSRLEINLDALHQCRWASRVINAAAVGVNVKERARVSVNATHEHEDTETTTGSPRKSHETTERIPLPRESVASAFTPHCGALALSPRIPKTTSTPPKSHICLPCVHGHCRANRSRSAHDTGHRIDTRVSTSMLSLKRVAAAPTLRAPPPTDTRIIAHAPEQSAYGCIYTAPRRALSPSIDGGATPLSRAPTLVRKRLHPNADTFIDALYVGYTAAADQTDKQRANAPSTHVILLHARRPNAAVLLRRDTTISKTRHPASTRGPIVLAYTRPRLRTATGSGAISVS
ncbi:hypothetical protein B0H16DRAFT_1887277 [Mycena metata]|uniref:Uncharacterized protein n=1 Tax=Mycena metata TaxID=1033252 RepID=A0AAD7NB54_9AGAR|nr:hypothetical protein B0H16DRAFT_1887277 [Mycena metata]